MENTNISWCDHTFNAWIGCTKVNEACKFCYAEAHDKRFYKQSHWGPNTSRQMTSDKYWNQPRNWNKSAGLAKVQLRVFCSSLADVFEDHPQVIEARQRLFKLIEETPNLIWMLLTKRPGNIDKMIPESWNRNLGLGGSVPENVRFGVSIGNQKQFDEMWPVMEESMYNHGTPYFLSMEPLLGPVDFAMFDEPVQIVGTTVTRSRHLPSYIIVGGESGSKARPMHPEWVDKIKNQCFLYNISFHFKQWGEWNNGSDVLSRHNYVVLTNGEMYEHTKAGIEKAAKQYGSDWSDLKPTAMCKLGKDRTGDLLDGRRYKDLIE